MNRSNPTVDAKIRADEHRLISIRNQLDIIVQTSPSPKLKQIAHQARKQIRL
jgi:hypothetical protein